jgi:hypothetical protein
MAKKFPIHPANPERICWGCDTFCSVSSMACANERSPHPAELFGDDWTTWGETPQLPPSDPTPLTLPASTPAEPDTQATA